MIGSFIQPPHDLVTKEISKVKADILPDENEAEKYNISRERLETLLTENKEQIKKMLNAKKFLALLNKE